MKVSVTIKKVCASVLAALIMLTSEPIHYSVFANEEQRLMLTKELDGVIITLEADSGVFPLDARLFVEKIEEAEKVEKIERSINDTMMQLSKNSKSTEKPKTIERTYSYDIKVLDEKGNELQPNNNKGDVFVSFANVGVSSENLLDNSIEVYHINDTFESAEPIDTKTNFDEGILQIVPKHFSIYTVTVSTGIVMRYFKGSTSAEQYYMISTAADLVAFSEIVNGTKTGTVDVYTETGPQGTMTTQSLNKNAKLINDITGVTNWVPIGTGTPYTATFDGDGHSITIDSLSNTFDSYVGVFGKLDTGAAVKNLAVRGTINAKANSAFVGGIAGYVTNGTITNCKNQANITGAQFVGGIVGFWGNGILKNCENQGEITGTNSGAAYVGGICGRNGTSRVIDMCFNTGTIKSTTSAIGLGGIAGSNLGTIQNCYNSGTISGTSATEIGGIVGINENSVSVIQNCYNLAAVTGYTSVGGILGSNKNAGVIQGVYNTGYISGRKSGDSYVGGILGEMLGGTLYYVHNSGTVYSQGQGTGGIVGGNWNGMCAPIRLKSCYNEGTVSGIARASDGNFILGGIAGIFGYNTTNTLYMGWCYNKAILQGSVYSHWSIYGSSPNCIGNCLGYYSGAAGANLNDVTISSFGNTPLTNMTAFYNDSGSSLGLLSWTGNSATPSLNGTCGTTSVASTTVNNRPYYTNENNVVRVYANGYPIVIHGFGAGEVTTGVYWDKNCSGTYDSGDTAVSAKNGSGSCLFPSGSSPMYIYGGGEGVDYNSSAAEIYLEGGKVNAIFGGGNGSSVRSANIYVNGGIVNDIYAGAINCNMTGNSSIYINSGTITGSVKGEYDGSSTVGYSRIFLSGNPSVTGSVDLNSFTDKYVSVTGNLTGSDGSINLSNPQATTEGTNLVYGNPSSLLNKNVFSLSGNTLRISGNFIVIKNYYNQSVSVKINGTLTNIPSVLSDSEGLYVKEISSSSYLPLTRSSVGQYGVTDLGINDTYNIYYKKGTEYIQIAGTACNETSNSITLEYVSVTNTITNISSSNTNTILRKNYEYSTIITPATGYSLPETLSITSGATTLNADTDYSYSGHTGTLTIQGAKTAGNIEITATGVPNTYTITYLNQLGGAFVGEHQTGYPTSHTYDTSTSLKLATRPGYDFVGWYTTPNCSGTAVTTIGGTDYTSGITLYAKWTPRNDTPYTVKHLLQGLDGVTYNLADTDNLTGTSDTDVTPYTKVYTGFIAPQSVTSNVDPNGSSIISYLYDRESYTLTWDTDGGNALTGTYTNGSVKYDAPITAPDDPTKDGFIFTGWDSSLVSKMPANDLTYTATWIPVGTTETSVEATLETPPVVAGLTTKEQFVPAASADKGFTKEEIDKISNDGASLKLALAVKEVDKTAATPEVSKGITSIADSANEAGCDVKYVLDLTVDKYIKEAGEDNYTKIGNVVELPSVIAVTVKVPDGINIDKIAIWRNHEGVVTKLQQVETATGKDGTFTVNAEAREVTIYTKYFSIYAIGQEQEKPQVEKEEIANTSDNAVIGAFAMAATVAMAGAYVSIQRRKED